MPSEPIRVEVVACGNCAAAWSDVGPGCCVNPIRGNDAFPKWYATLAPDSLAARQIELAVAVVRWEDAQADADQGLAPLREAREFAAAKAAYLAALKAVREHPSYRPADTGGDDA